MTKPPNSDADVKSLHQKVSSAFQYLRMYAAKMTMMVKWVALKKATGDQRLQLAL